MSFNFVAAGTRDQVCGSLDRLSDQDLGYDNFGIELRDALVDAISQGTDLAPPSDQKYEVKVSGHSSRGGVVTLDGYVKLVSISPQPPDAQLADHPADSNLTETPVAVDNLDASTS